MVALGLGALLLGGAGCRKARTRPSVQQRTDAQRPIEVPEEVVAYLGLRNPHSGLDDLLGIANQFVPLPVDRNGVLDLLTQRAHLPHELFASIDPTATFWLIFLDGQRLGEPDPGLLVFPLRSRRDFEAALDKRMQRSGKEGELRRYLPRPGEVGVRELRLLVTDRHVIVPSSRKVMDLCLPFVRRNLLDHPPSYDLALHVMTEHLAHNPRQDLQKQIDRALEQMRSRVPRPGREGSIDRAPAANAAEEAIRYYGGVLKSTRELILTVDVDPAQITVAVRAEGTPGGLLHRLIQRQRPGPVFGKELLPASSWLVLSNHSNPEAAAERQKTWASTVRSTFRKLEPGQATRFQSALVELGKRFTGDVALALHRAPSGSGITVTAVAGVNAAEPARQAMEQLAEVTHDWLRDEMRKERDPSLRGTKVSREPFSRDGAKGSVLTLTLEYPEPRREELVRLLGDKVGLGWAFKGNQAIFTAGKEALEQLDLLVASATAGKLAGGLAETSAFRRAHNASPTRIGLLYVSLLDLARWFEGSGIEQAEAVARALRKTRVSSAPSLDWGVNAARTQLDVTLHLPVEHFRAFKPIFNELMKTRAATGLGQGGWPKAEREGPP